ncbi:MAG: hypothetical protein RLZZ453_50 [Chlamydiota bacterium]
MLVAFLFYDGMTALDAIGPHEVLSRLPGAKVVRVAQKKGSIRTASAGLEVTAEYSLSDVSSADILVVPGAGRATALRDHPDILEWIRLIHKTTEWTTSVCTGSLILGAAGLLKGCRATSHWAVLDRLLLWGAEPIPERVVESGKIMTAAGVSAGIDMALILAEKMCSKAVAQTLQLGIEYDPKPPFDVGSPAKADPKIREALRARLTALFEIP